MQDQNQNLPLTYTDLVCDLDLDPFGTETISDLHNLVQDVTHILLEELGTNPDDPTRGVGILTFLSANNLQFDGLPQIIENQLKDDDRIDNATAQIFIDSAGVYNLVVNIQVNGTVLPLSFVFQNGGMKLLSSTEVFG